MSPNRAALEPSAQPGHDAEEDVPVVPVRPETIVHPPEIGGRAGPDPTRYGDWEKAGRCIDF
ncbi:MAG TPA: DUF1674 domain-containing protein [Steroidobacteraceae bacterium]|nr:DUF1674 domain-containing protein [Steroidobacteraceae bacterium]